MSQPPSKPSWWSNEAEAIKAWGLAHWSYIAVFLVGLVMGALIF